MAKRNYKRKPAKLVAANDVPAIAADAMDATPERLKKGDIAEAVNPALSDSGKHSNTLVRRFRSTHLDRLYKKDNPSKSRFTDRQYAAGDWYRNTHARCSFALSVVASYGERTSAGEPSYGLPRSEAQLRARKLWMAGRKQLPVNMVGFMDRFLVYDELPRYGGRAAMRNLEQIGYSLDLLADWLKFPR